MVTYSDHLRRILLQISESYDLISDTKETELDVEGVKRELHRINGSIRAILSGISEYDMQSSDFGALRSKFSRYLAEYEFESELDAIATLYSEDRMRIKNMRVLIAKALADRKMIESMRELADEL